MARGFARDEIVRPRLIRALTHSRARIRLLSGPAGFGKTTLARQWSEGLEGDVAWLRLAGQSCDVAAVASRLGECLEGLIPGGGLSLSSRLGAARDPAGEAELLGEIAAEATAFWPQAAWLVVDDLHEVETAASVDSFLRAFVVNGKANTLVTTRRRPSWITDRQILYGEVLEIGQRDLAFTNDEVEQVLGATSRSVPGDLLHFSDGWPALVALARRVSWAGNETLDLPNSVYAFFAEEVFSSFGDRAREVFPSLARLPLIDETVVTNVFGEHANPLLEEAISMGILIAEGNELRFHPLAKAYLESLPAAAGETKRISGIAVAHYVSQRRWDSIAALAEQTRDTGMIDGVLETCLGDMLDAGRLETLRRLVRAGSASEEYEDARFVQVAEAEIELRVGNYASALLLVNRLGRCDRPENPLLNYLADMVRGRALYMRDDTRAAALAFDRAAASAPTEERRREAQWSELMCAIGLETPEASRLLASLEKTARNDVSSDLIRLTTNRLVHQVRSNARLDVESGSRCLPLLSRTADLFVVTGFRAVFGHVLTLAGRYAAALEQADVQLDTIRRFRLDFASPHARTLRAAALTGLRRYPEAIGELSAAALEAERFGDLFAAQNLYTTLVRVFAQSGQLEKAVRLEVPDTTGAFPSMVGEVRAAKSFIHALAGERDAALSLAQEAIEVTQSSEVGLLAEGARILAILRTGPPPTDAARTWIETAASTRVIDPIVCLMRAAPDVLAWALAAPALRVHVLSFMERAGDWDVPADQREVDPRPLVGSGSGSALTPREHEVFHLLVSGMTNAEIASSLVISRETVKLHVHHIYDKLGVRSRAALTVAARLRAIPQAASRALPTSEPLSIADKSVQ